MLRIKEIVNVTEIEPILAAAQADNHYLLGPTHYWIDEKSGDVRGYFSAGVIPHCHFWMHTKSTPRESMEIVHQCEEITKQRFANHPIGIIACHPSSPFNSRLQSHFGYQPVIRGTDLFYAKLSNTGLHDSAKRTTKS